MTGQRRSEGNHRRASSCPLRRSAAPTDLRRQGCGTTTGHAGAATWTLLFLPSACAASPTATSRLGDGDAP
eukprot:8176133-Alexandrium_andersonii.AAC.1